MIIYASFREDYDNKDKYNCIHVSVNREYESEISSSKKEIVCKLDTDKCAIEKCDYAHEYFRLLSAVNIITDKTIDWVQAARDCKIEELGFHVNNMNNNFIKDNLIRHTYLQVLKDELINIKLSTKINRYESAILKEICDTNNMSLKDISNSIGLEYNKYKNTIHKYHTILDDLGEKINSLNTIDELEAFYIIDEITNYIETINPISITDSSTEILDLCIQQ